MHLFTIILDLIKNNKPNALSRQLKSTGKYCHLTGRLLNRRGPYEVDLPCILEAAANNVALEINSHPDRLDIDEFTARKVKD